MSKTLRILTLGMLLAALLTAFFSWDAVVSGEYRRHRAEWERDGRPNGFLWRAAGTVLTVPKSAGNWRASGWILHTPLWVNDTPSAQDALTRVRCAVIVWCIGLPMWFWFFQLRPKSGRSGRGEAVRGALAR